MSCGLRPRSEAGAIETQHVAGANRTIGRRDAGATLARPARPRAATGMTKLREPTQGRVATLRTVSRGCQLLTPVHPARRRKWAGLVGATRRSTRYASAHERRRVAPTPHHRIEAALPGRPRAGAAMLYLMLVFGHLLATSMALGAIVATDLRMLSKLAQDRVRIPPPNEFVARLVTIALVLLYVTRRRHAVDQERAARLAQSEAAGQAGAGAAADVQRRGACTAGPFRASRADAASGAGAPPTGSSS